MLVKFSNIQEPNFLEVLDLTKDSLKEFQTEYYKKFFGNVQQYNEEAIKAFGEAYISITERVFKDLVDLIPNDVYLHDISYSRVRKRSEFEKKFVEFMCDIHNSCSDQFTHSVDNLNQELMEMRRVLQSEYLKNLDSVEIEIND